MTVEAEIHKPALAARPQRSGLLRSLRRLGIAFQRGLGHYVFSSLTRRIVFLNLAALAILVVGVLYLNQFRDGLTQARIDSLTTQGEIIAGAIASSASIDADSIHIDPEKLLELQAGESLAAGSDSLDNLDFPIDPEEVGRFLRRLISLTNTRARLFDREGNSLADTRQGQILRYNLPPVDNEDPSLLARIEKHIFNLFRNADYPVYKEPPGGSGLAFPEVVAALEGKTSTIVRVSEQGEQIVSVAVPIKRTPGVLGVLMLSTEGGDIDRYVAKEQRAILRVFGVAALANAVLSILLASTIANPLRRLSAAAVRVRRGVKKREEIPDFSDRQDEIGNLSVAVRDMTNALYNRIDAIESFAADVSHELKNPLTSLRSAVETLPLAKNPDSRERLMAVIQHDVKRLDRLITDISDASRLDAELAREDAERVDLRRFIGDLVSVSSDAGHKKPVEIEFHAAKLPSSIKGYYVLGHDLRIGQVITNLIENARSFVPDKTGKISIALERRGRYNLITVEDNGPGIRADNIDRIFERFYTDRPSSEAFGQNSGLGLSISRQIVEAHGGTISAENIPGGKPGELRGARFTVTMPAEG